VDCRNQSETAETATTETGGIDKQPVCPNAVAVAVQESEQLERAARYTHQSQQYEDEHWEFPSSSNPNKKYKVSRRKVDGLLVCSCPKFIFQRVPVEKKKPCKHILEVLGGNVQPVGAIQKPAPQIVLYNIQEVTPVMDAAGNVIEVKTPLIPAGNDNFATHFQATLIYDLLRYGVPYSQIRERYGLARVNSAKDIVRYVRANGRMVYKPEALTGEGRSIPYGEQFQRVEAPENDGLDAIAGTAPF